MQKTHHILLRLPDQGVQPAKERVHVREASFEATSELAEWVSHGGVVLGPLRLVLLERASSDLDIDGVAAKHGHF